MFEAVSRFAIEYVRYYEAEMHFNLFGAQPTYNQVVSLGLFIAGLVLYVICHRRGQKPDALNPTA